MTTRIAAFLRFWYDFLVGDDWRIAAAVVTALALTGLVALTTVPAWWVLPATVLVLLPLSLRTATRRAPARRREPDST
jgi:hypothetical protein